VRIVLVASEEKKLQTTVTTTPKEDDLDKRNRKRPMDVVPRFVGQIPVILLAHLAKQFSQQLCSFWTHGTCSLRDYGTPL
jgi:hypothetical protein